MIQDSSEHTIILLLLILVVSITDMIIGINNTTNMDLITTNNIHLKSNHYTIMNIAYGILPTAWLDINNGRLGG